MVSFNEVSTPQVLNNHISVQVAASYSGYSTQYLRRLLRTGKLEGVKIGQTWLIEKALSMYISSKRKMQPTSASVRSSFFRQRFHMPSQRTAVASATKIVKTG